MLERACTGLGHWYREKGKWGTILDTGFSGLGNWGVLLNTQEWVWGKRTSFP